jgi:diguanylate cyclase (GGDEF)-like protein
MRFWRHSDASVRRWPLSAKLLILSSLVTVIGFSTICMSVMLDMRRGEEELARQTAENLATTIDADIARTVELYDLSLRAVVSGMTMPEINDLSPPMRHLMLFDHAATASHFGAIQVFDAQGDLLLDASTFTPKPENRADEDYFKVHRGDPGAGLFISRPMLHRSTYSVVLSRRISGADGRFLGVVAGAIRFSYFHELFERLRLDARDTILVLRRDGTVIMRTPFDLDVIGRDLSKGVVVPRMMKEPSGVLSAYGAVDGIHRLYVWSDATKPLMVLVGKPWSNIFALWQKQAIRIGAIMLGLICFVFAVSVFLAREIGRRARAEGKLEELATTDALTGLKNRRKFDAELDEEWRRASRQMAPLALLLIDADHFKAFNDAFGHQAGDQALTAIARCIGGSVRRAGECAARYGGEEFAVLLPGYSAHRALEIAKAICDTVERLPANPIPLTVSIGIASLTPLVTMESHELVEAADKALYAAKAGGRNCCVMAKSDRIALVA